MGRFAGVTVLLAVACAWAGSFAANAQSQSPSSCVRSPIGARPIVAFGDSATWGVGAGRNCVQSSRHARPLAAHAPGTSDTTYPAILGRSLHLTVLDYGVRGESTDSGLQRIARVLAATQPSEVLVLEGFQDLIRGDTPAVIASRLVLVGQLIQSYGARPVLLTLYPPSPSRLAGGKIRSLDGFIRNQSRLRGFLVIDLSNVFRRKAHVLSAGLYPNDTGYAVLARAIAAGLRHGRG